VLRQQPLNIFWIRYDLYGGQKGMIFFPDAYPKGIKTRRLVRLQEYEASCAVDWIDWKPSVRAKAGLSRFPEAADVRARLEACSRVVISQAALELGDSDDPVSKFLGDAQIVAFADIAKAAKLNRAKQASPEKSRMPTIPLEVTFPFTLDRSAIRDLLEKIVKEGKIGYLDGWSSGPQRFEVGLIVTEADAAIQSIQAALAAHGHDPGVFEFAAED